MDLNGSFDAPEVGILYLVLSTFLFIFSFFKGQPVQDVTITANAEKLSALYERAILTVGQEDAREFGQPFITSGNHVAAIALVVCAVEFAMLVLILRI